jgi:hypothetical protein
MDDRKLVFGDNHLQELFGAMIEEINEEQRRILKILLICSLR